MNRSDVEKQLDSDLQIVLGLRKQGDQNELPRIIEHHFVAPNRAALDALLKIGAMLGFEVAETQVETKAEFVADLLTESPIDLNTRARESILMAALAESFGCSYDGWGTFVMRAGEG